MAAPACEQPDLGAGAGDRLPCASEVPRPSGLLLAGSGTNLPLVRRIVARFREAHPGIEIRLLGNVGSGGAARAVADRAIDVGLLSRPLREAERARGLVATLLARVPVVIVAHPAVPDAAITAERLVRIYDGEPAQWMDGSPVVPLLREPGDSARRVIAQAWPEVEAAYTRAFARGRGRVCYTDGEMREALLTVPGALGLLDLGAIRLGGLPLRVLSVDGVAPATDVVRAGRDPHRKWLGWVTRGPPTGAARQLLEFAGSAAVTSLLAAGGYLAPAGEPR